jgi:hypothetical protein
MTLADYARFALLIALGVLSFIVFLVAGTLVGLMFVDPYGCRCVHPFPPVGLYVLGVLGILLLIPAIRTAVNDAPEYLEKAGLTSYATIALIVISILVLILIL